MIPTPDETRRLFELYRMPGHILAHSIMVSRVAMAIGSSLWDSGHDIDLSLVEASALLHDICKMECIGTGNDHAFLGCELLCRHGYSRVGDVVGQHVHLRSFILDEAMVVNYADKRVMHTRVVSLDARFADLIERYGTDEVRRERIRTHLKDSQRVEELIARSCGADLRELERLNLVPVDEALYGG